MTRVPGLDLLRGVAIGLVLLRHAAPGWFPGAGVVGVVVFFALSGWLITGLLLDEHARSGRVDLRAFYVRRARRLVPALVVVVAVVAAVTLLLDPLGDRDSLARDTVVALTWTGNLPGLTPGGATFHLWTLATEEQFYLLWPALLLLVLGRTGRAGGAVVVAALASLAACVAGVVWLREAPDLAYALPTSWAGCFVVGAAARVWRRRVPAAVAVVVVPLALGLLGVLSLVELRGHAWTYLVVGPVVALAATALVLAWQEWVVVAGPLRLLVGLGTLSYGAYLWSWPLTLWLRPAGPVVAAGLGLGLTLLAAWASHRWVEQPWRVARPRPARDLIAS